MDVDKTSFYPLLLDILTDISTSAFVAIDLELSGVPTKESWVKNSSVGKQTLQERYLEVKAAAERYQILQIGLTCVEQNLQAGKYTLKPYNFDLCPIVNERIDIEREFSFSSGAAEFLLRVGFDMNRPFAHGVPYLSRSETRVAREKYTLRQDRSAISDIALKPTEFESLAFLERVRSEINAWVDSKHLDTPEYLNIAPVGFGTMLDGEPSTEELSRYEKRLVHQLVRAEYPELVTMSRKGFIQIIKFDKEREDRVAEGKKREHEERIGRQKGFRWIIEAMLGNNIANMDLKECAKDSVTGQPIFYDRDDFKAQFSRAQALLRRNPVVLVGHNCFLDLVYVYRTFIGTLPDTVEEFQNTLHRCWPIIVDTKYMSTHNCGDISPASSLEQIATQLSAERTPIVDTDPQHTKYNNVEAYHEAGYDSFLTAQVAVRLSAKLERQGAYIDVDKQTPQSTSRPQDVTNGVSHMKLSQSPEADGSVKVNGNAGDAPVEGFTPSVVGGKWKRVGDPTLGPPAKDDPFEYNPRDLQHRYKREAVTIPGGVPVFGSDFWRVYGNKLRVFGTQEGVCILDEQESPSGSDDGGVDV
ncbi:CAF1 family ribonuclease like [Lecanosticta acicola]|uniref:CAF1 family ribonuclease like n=1 Tax=Lecanosticta acicola TaxID=111012 RepID=A0AAI8YY51_9PEZI|nr:CAF1 family ribonuclease like [Lecanosticta acicola]